MHKLQITLSPETIQFAINEGIKIFRTSKKLTAYDTEERKIANCIFGAYAQQAFIEATGGRRVTKKEVPRFYYDVVCSNSAFANYIGWSDKELWLKTKEKGVRVEIKNVHGASRTWASFYDSNIEYAVKCANNQLYDCFVGYATTVVDPKRFIANVELWVAVNTRALLDRDCFRKSSFNTPMHYFVKNSVESRNWGKVFI